MPPVMGAAAFLIAEYLGLSYGEVALAAAIPAGSTTWRCSSRSTSRPPSAVWPGCPPPSCPARPILRMGGVFAIPLVVLVYG